MKRSTFITWEQLRVGVVVVVSLLIMILAVFKLGQAANLFAKRYTLTTFLANANGLRDGGTVSVAGQVVGTIDRIDLLPPSADTTRKLRLVLSIDQKVQQQVRSDSRARVRTMGLLGDKIIDISPGSPRYASLAQGDTIPAAESLDYEQVIQQASGAVADMVQLTHDLKAITGGVVRGEGTMGQLVTNRSLYDELETTLARTNQLMTRLQNPQGTFGKMVDDPTLYYRLTSVIASTDTLLVAMTSQKGTVGKLLHDDSLYTNLVGITHGADSLMKTLTSGHGLANKLLTDQQLYDQLNKLVTDMNTILADVKRDPKRYMKGAVQIKLF